MIRTSTLSAATKFYLIYLAGHMSPDLKVSRPRGTVAKDLHVTTRTIDSRNSLAVESGFLVVLRKGQKHVTAEYLGTFPDSPSARKFLRAEDTLSAKAVLRAENCKNLRAEKSELSVDHALSAKITSHHKYSGPLVGGTNRNVGIDEHAAPSSRQEAS